MRAKLYEPALARYTGFAMYSLRDRILTSKVDGEIILLDLDSGKYFGLNKTASAMLETLMDAKDEIIACQRLHELYPQASGRIEDDFRTFLSSMVSKGLLQTDES